MLILLVNERFDLSQKKFLNLRYWVSQNMYRYCIEEALSAFDWCSLRPCKIWIDTILTCIYCYSTTCTFNSNFSVECILIFECGLFECFQSLSIYMNVEQWSFIQILSHKVALYVDHMYINIHKKNSPVAWYCWRRPVRGTVI